MAIKPQIDMNWVAIGRTYALACGLSIVSSSAVAQVTTYIADGLVVPETQIIVSSQVSAVVSAMPVADGGNFKKGDTLAVFDCTILEAQRDAQQERSVLANQRNQMAQRLGRSGAASKGDVQLALSESKIALAELRAIEAQVQGCLITAPFDGWVVETTVSAFEYVSETQELLSLVSRSNLEVELIVPSDWLKWLKEGSEFDFQVFETDMSYSAEVKTLGAVVDPVSRTLKISAKFNEPYANILPGMTGVGSF